MPDWNPDAQKRATIENVSRRTLLASALILESAILLVAVSSMGYTGLWPGIDVTSSGLGIGLLAGAAMAGGVILIARSHARFFHRVRQDLDLIIRLFGKCRLPDLAIVSLLAGVGEEMLFRGLLQSWLLTFLPPHPAVFVTAAAFGAAHAISPSYAVFATVLGLILGYVCLWTGGLPAAMMAHAVYDFGALYYGTRILRARDSRNP